MTLNAVVGVGLIEGQKRNFFDQYGSRESNSHNVFGGFESSASNHIRGFPPNSRDNIVYRRKR
jgi:hypothetical protein